MEVKDGTKKNYSEYKDYIKDDRAETERNILHVHQVVQIKLYSSPHVAHFDIGVHMVNTDIGVHMVNTCMDSV